MLMKAKFSAMFLRVACLVLFTQPVLAGVIYTWVDENGVTHYSQQPPTQEQQKAQQLYSEDLEPGKIGYIAPAKKEAPPEMSESEKSAALIKEKDAKQAEAICENAKHNLDVLTTHTKLTRQQEGNKEPVAMTEEERQTAINENQQRIKLFCDKK
ncbi:DUF4124 domain-containing protein [Shewanella sp.]|uniref:DUF4124 domain-containing protein n=1 Tax=Shewanella sp. TaxID=50422 RepID=UPI003A893E2E